ncbi:MAG: phospholipid scramblase-related protein [Acidimicrobiales bacterium]
MVDTPPPAPNWYPDPMGRHEYRWWDGLDWSDQVSSHGRPGVDSLEKDAKMVAPQQAPDKIQQQVQKHANQVEKRGAPQPTATSFSDHGSATGLMEQPILVINQKWKLIEVNTEFAIFDANGNQVGAVRQVGQNAFKKVIRFFGSIDQYFTHKYQVVDLNNQPILLITRPAKFIKSRVVVQDAVGAEVGQIVQKNVFGKIKFMYLVNGQEIGGIFAENWRAWNFSIKDANDNEVARITKTFEGLLKTAFTTADNYVLQVHQPLSGPLQQMVYASAVTVDTALKQDARGVSGGGMFDMLGG